MVGAIAGRGKGGGGGEAERLTTGIPRHIDQVVLHISGSL